MSALRGTVLGDRDLCEKILSLLTRREAAKVALVCKQLSTMVTNLEAAGRLKPRLVVVSSGNSQLVEIDPWTDSQEHCRQTGGGPAPEAGTGGAGEVLGEPARAHRIPKPGITKKVSRKDTIRWSTGIAFNRRDGTLYLNQYKDEGVLRFKGSNLGYRRKFHESKKCSAPEGLAIASKHIYVASVQGKILRLDACGHAVSHMGLPDLCLGSSEGGRTAPCVPWGMAAYRDTALYVCIDEAYERTDCYGQRNPRGEGLTGAVARINLDSDGGFAGVSIFCGGGRFRTGATPPAEQRILARPSGLCFDARGHMYVTSLTDQVLVFEGPDAEEPGAYRGVAVDLAAAGLAHPFDVKWMRDVGGGEAEGMLAVTTHTAVKARTGRLNGSKLSFFSVDGRLLRSVTSEKFNEPNMMAVE